MGGFTRFEAGEEPQLESRRLDIQEIGNYRHALRTAVAELETRPFNLNLLRTLHSSLLDSVRGGGIKAADIFAPCKTGLGRTPPQ